MQVALFSFIKNLFKIEVLRKIESTLLDHFATISMKSSKIYTQQQIESGIGEGKRSALWENSFKYFFFRELIKAE